MTELDYGAFDALRFDCYGTLIDWAAGILAGLRTAFAPHGVDAPERSAPRVVRARSRRGWRSGTYLTYRTILAMAARSVGAGLDAALTDDEAIAFGGSVEDWPAFADSTGSLRILRRRFQLGVLTNCDDDLFAASNRRLGVDFDWVVTAQQVGSYKLNVHNFEVLRERLHTSGIRPAASCTSPRACSTTTRLPSGSE